MLVKELRKRLLYFAEQSDAKDVQTWARTALAAFESQFPNPDAEVTDDTLAALDGHEAWRLTRQFRLFGRPAAVDRLRELLDATGFARYASGADGPRVDMEDLRRLWDPLPPLDPSTANPLATYVGAARDAEAVRKRTPISPKLRHDVFRRDDLRCRMCGRSAKESGVVLEIDHIRPVARGGTNDIENLQTLCRECNSGKSDRDDPDDGPGAPAPL